VPDAEKAVAAIADSLPTGCLLAFSVPMYGRLEAVFGHLSIFDADRIDAMVRAARLEVVSAEPLANRWSLVVTRKIDAPPTPPAAATNGVRAAPDPLIHLVDPKAFRSKAGARLKAKGTRVTVSIPGGPAGFALRRLPPRACGLLRVGQEPTTCELTIPVSGTLARMRLSLLGADGEPLAAEDTNLEVRAMAGGKRLAKWVCEAPKAPLRVLQPMVFRRGIGHAPFRVKGTQDIERPADRLELVVTVPAGVWAKLTVSDVGWAWR
jgi:hypothetical protein